ncbi:MULTISPECIES: GAF domain-containing protein [unclassified Mycolicibacterium]|uniref:helix-turn-helix domain-containing protein n=1 Tax=unclassified Mycolicibacterium TaxID=2636767 RepID=UPI0012DC565D|nr:MULTISPECIES: GAF domain-containing protein [unclassified Mycolicibacterium]MUL81347.1 GAF domain-containing protein [Mycolicibacterium sp. CBMA 329]MUL87113.1 GAF domain-containing protein [Mycolicibacterium sp. CBMA 331]MUL98605.1 GAF domain-containing protein [Mycolicibacterium sp. CBMA 334]MUM28339.1 GAF domain-containing protein [Mycolicibacterium sp. CBMA 295]MUM37410.1 GAF domain-containing protein [Mycolicibacterium sp. CBMA 247]
MSKTSGGRVPSESVRAAHDLFVEGQVDATYLDSTSLRRVVVESWQRSLSTGVDPDLATRAATAAAALTELRDTHPLAPTLPLIRRLLVEDAVDAGVLVAITAADGTLLWVEGDAGVRRKAEAMNFVPGSDWSERTAGTNAPGTALALDRELQILGSEHFSRIVHPWSCTAVPVHDPATGALLGAIDLTGGSAVASPQTLALVRATAVAVENQLALLRLTGPAAPAAAEGARLTVLGADRPRWQVADAAGRPQASVLTGRHADILVLLIRHPEGLSADHLAMLLDDKDLDVVTVRAEVSRLRRVIGSTYIESRPYRLLAPVASDMGDVYDALQAGSVSVALDAYSGALLPQSVSPAIARLRTELSASLREAVLAGGSLNLLRRWLALPDGRDDRQGWRVLHDHAEADPVARAQARGHLAGIDSELG